MTRIDQAQPTVESTAGGFIVGGSTSAAIAQTLTAGISGRLTQVELPIGCASDLTLRLELQTVGSDGRPSGAALATRTLSGQTLPAFRPGTDAFRAISFETPARVSAGTAYAIVASAASPSAAQCHWYIGPVGDPYGRGSGYGRSATTWTLASPARNDFGFRTFVEIDP